MNRFTVPVLACVLTLASGPALADGYPAKIILDSGVNVVGETIVYPTTGAANVTAAIVTMAPGEKTVVHEHGVPLFAYILEGELTVDYEGHGKKTYRPGDAFLEAMRVWHHGINTGTGPVKLLAVYMGAKGSENVIPQK
jgi:quercetin dioxygenase-like cupin family protein